MGQPVTLLVDSGSTASFINVRLKHHLSNVSRVAVHVRVKVADDRELSSTEEVLNCKWVSQGYEFATSFKLLQLGAFDIILGQDWIYKHNPMHIDWPTKRLKIADQGCQFFSKVLVLKLQCVTPSLLSSYRACRNRGI